MAAPGLVLLVLGVAGIALNGQAADTAQRTAAAGESLCCTTTQSEPVPADSMLKIRESMHAFGLPALPETFFNQ